MESQLNEEKKLTKQQKQRKKELRLASILLSVSLFSTGVLNCVMKSNGVPKFYDKQISYLTNFNYIPELLLNNIKSLNLCVDSKKDLSWLNKCSDLKELSLTFNSNDFSCLKDLNGLSFPNLKDFKVCSVEGGIFSSECFRFLSDCASLTNLTIENLEIKSEFLEEFTDLKYLAIDKFILNKKIDFWKLNNLSVLDFKDNGIYDVMMFLDDKDCNFLLDNNVIVLANGSQNVMPELEKVNDELQRAVDICNLDESLNDKEKLNRILDYVSYKFEYDYAFINIEEEIRDYEQFYKNGYLYGALCKEDRRVICGNYAALFQALATRCGLESYLIYSKVHAYNLVNIEDAYYFTDPTYLDSTYVFDNTKISASEVINMGYEQLLKWYLNNPNVYYDEAHISKNIPSDLDIKVKTKPPLDYKKIRQDLLCMVLLYILVRRIYNRRIENNNDIKIKRLKND